MPGATSARCPYWVAMIGALVLVCLLSGVTAGDGHIRRLMQRGRDR